MEYEPIDVITGLPLIPSSPSAFDGEIFGDDYKGPTEFGKENESNV